MNQRYTVVVERDEEGYYVAYVPSLGPGVAAQARTRVLAVSRLRSVVQSYIGALKEEGMPIPKDTGPVTVATLEIAA